VSGEASGTGPYLECTTAGDRLVLVERGGQQTLAVVEKLGDARLERGHTGGPTNQLHKFDTVLAHVRCVQCQAQRNVQTLNQVLDLGLQVLPTLVLSMARVRSSVPERSREKEGKKKGGSGGGEGKGTDRVICERTSTSSVRFSTLKAATLLAESIFFTRSHAVRRRSSALGLLLTSTLCLA
jgi:hypothetical protein